LLAGAIVAAETSVLAAQAAVEEVPVPGGIAALARALDIGALDRAQCLPQVVRAVYADLDKIRADPESLYLRLLGHLDASASGAEARTSDLIPVPLTAPQWSRAVFRRAVSRETLFRAIIADPNAALLAHGLSALDDETLRFLADHPALVETLYKRHAIVFASFTAKLRIRGNRVVPPGGELAVPLWEAVLRARVTDPAKFMTALYASADGRMAYLYDVIGHLDDHRARFALGLWLPDAATRVERFREVSRVAASFAGNEWNASGVPFTRPLFDFVTLFNRVQVEPSGAPRFPASQTLWTEAISARGGAGDADAVRSENDMPIDAAWLAATVLMELGPSRQQRLDQFAFGQRAFGSARDADTSQLVTAIGLFPRVPMLMLALERSGIRRPATFVALANHAEVLTEADASRASRALAQFQGAVALISRLVRVQTIDVTAAERLLNELASVPFDRQRGYLGGVASWMQHHLGPAIGVTADVRLDDALTLALAGRASRSAMAPLSWEGQMYVFDLSASEARRLRRFTERRVVATIEVTCRLRERANKVGAGTAAMGSISDTFAEVRATLAKLPNTAKTVQRLTPPFRSALETSQLVLEAVDILMADSLSSWAYAIDWSDPGGHARIDRDVHRRHNFGLTGRLASARAAWTLPRLVFNAGQSWHVHGALLGLEVPLAALALRRTDMAPPVREPRLLSTNYYSFVASFGLMNVFALRDDDADAIAAAVARGQRRVETLRPAGDEVRAVIDEIAMDGWRARALRWSVVHAPDRVPALFSMTELVHLGGGGRLDVRAWGMSALEVQGCFCTDLLPPTLQTAVSGRHRLGMLPVAVPDLNLRVAVVLRELRMPAALAKSVLEAALYDFLSNVGPAYPDDWLTLVQHARALSSERIADYLAAATTAAGPLTPAPAAGRLP
jgi:hypothetical protein